MFITFKFAYQLWGTMDKAAVAAQVVKTSITADQYKEIVGEDYVAPAANTAAAQTGTANVTPTA